MNRLGPDVRLESGECGPVLRYLPRQGVVDVPPLPLHPLLAVALAHIDRGETSEKITAELAERLAAPTDGIKEIVDDARLCFRAHFKHSGSDSFVDLDTDALTERLAVPGAVFHSRDVVFPRDRALFPLTLQWLVTRYCNRQCIYCFAGAVPGARAKDAEISTERVCEILGQAARLGTYNFFLTGGEPLLRDDVYDVLAFALSLGLLPEVISKQFIPAEAASRLAEAGLQQIFLSIDSLDPAVARRMTGVTHYARDIKRTIERLVERGIAVNVKSVLTSENIDGIPAMVTQLEVLGVKWVGLDLYSRNLERHSDALIPSREQLLRLCEWTGKFKAGSGHKIEVAFSYDADQSSPADLGPDCIVCNNGITSILLMPDGRVSRCDKRLPGNEFIVGDLRTQSLHEAWSSPAMIESLKPPRHWYEGTLCEHCAQFDTCHERGRCYYSAYLTSGSLFGPQSNCPYLGDGRGAMTC